MLYDIFVLNRGEIALIRPEFFNLLEPATQWGKGFGAQQHIYRFSESEGGTMVPSKTISPAELSLGTYLTLSRYFHCYRWIWSLQSNDGGACSLQVPTSAMNRIITTLIRARLKQGFHFAQSHHGIQTMAIELPTKLNSGKHLDAANDENQAGNE